MQSRNFMHSCISCLSTAWYSPAWWLYCFHCFTDAVDVLILRWYADYLVTKNAHDRSHMNKPSSRATWKSLERTIGELGRSGQVSGLQNEKAVVETKFENGFVLANHENTQNLVSDFHFGHVNNSVRCRFAVLFWTSVQKCRMSKQWTFSNQNHQWQSKVWEEKRWIGQSSAAM
jgi:hypothetical protein